MTKPIISIINDCLWLFVLIHKAFNGQVFDTCIEMTGLCVDMQINEAKLAAILLKHLLIRLKKLFKSQERNIHHMKKE